MKRAFRSSEVSLPPRLPGCFRMFLAKQKQEALQSEGFVDFARFDRLVRLNRR